MRNNRRARPINEEMETKKLIYISVAVVIIAILAFTITYIAYSKVLSNNSRVRRCQNKNNRTFISTK